MVIPFARMTIHSFSIIWLSLDAIQFRNSSTSLLVSTQPHLQLLGAPSTAPPCGGDRPRLRLTRPDSKRRSAERVLHTSPDGVRGDLVSVRPEVLHLLVVSPLVRHVEGGRDGAAVGVLAACLEHLLVQLAVNVVDRVVKGEQHQLRGGLGFDVAWPDRVSVSGRTSRQTDR